MINKITDICNRLAPSGWAELMAHHGLDINAGDLASELERPLNNIDHQLPGFEDYAHEGGRAIEPGQPARSLLYHALASPNVTQTPDGSLLTKFPTQEEIETVENYVFATAKVSLQDLQNRVNGEQLHIVVFTSEYRPAKQTTHGKHADLCFARTGIARVGNTAADYDARRRGYIPVDPSDASKIRILPCRYSVWLAVKRDGDATHSQPMRFASGDEQRDFYLPVHKIFDGNDCLTGLPSPIQITLDSGHRNEKLKRLHLSLQNRVSDTGAAPGDLDQAPYTMIDGIASLNSHGSVVPEVHPRLIEPAEKEGRLLGFRVPGNAQVLSSSLGFTMSGSARPSPEFAHARHRIESDGSITDLNVFPDVAEIVKRGGYLAAHYIDFTGDGYVSASIPTLNGLVDSSISAFSLVAAPDFYPSTNQRELSEWNSGRTNIWQTPPDPLCDDRAAANPNHINAGFRMNDDTITAVVGLLNSGSQATQMQRMTSDPLRHSSLPDEGAGVFAPGWDVSIDRQQNRPHFANYGLGSPFPEDAKLCAALSAFWPAVAPDATRTMAPGIGSRTVSPMTDHEIGQTGGFPWDGINPPAIVRTPFGLMVEFENMDQADYVESALQGKMTLALTARITLVEYTNRILAMNTAYEALARSSEGGTPDTFLVINFSDVSASDEELLQAMDETGAHMGSPVYRIDFTRKGTPRRANSPKRVWYPLDTLVTVFVGTASFERAVLRIDLEPWTEIPV